MLGSFPLTRPEEFTTSPALLSSVRQDVSYRLRRRSGSWRSGDRFILMTDAIGKWFMQSRRGNNRATAALLASLTDQDGFEKWVAEERARGELRNDDVTVMLVEVER